MSRQITRRALRMVQDRTPPVDRYEPYKRNEGTGEGTKRMQAVVDRRKANWKTEETENNG